MMHSDNSFVCDVYDGQLVAAAGVVTACSKGGGGVAPQSRTMPWMGMVLIAISSWQAVSRSINAALGKLKAASSSL